MHAFHYLTTFLEYIQPFLEEVDEVVKSEQWTDTRLESDSLHQMHKGDSFHQRVPAIEFYFES